jgi:integrase/recombinase XerD
MSKRLKVAPSRLELEQIDAPLVIGFLNYLEATRSNGASSRNVRLTVFLEDVAASRVMQQTL